MDQRKVNMLAREYCEKIKRKLKPVILSHEMLPGLLEVHLISNPQPPTPKPSTQLRCRCCPACWRCTSSQTLNTPPENPQPDLGVDAARPAGRCN
jgi:hypothetical protein